MSDSAGSSSNPTGRPDGSESDQSRSWVGERIQSIQGELDPEECAQCGSKLGERVHYVFTHCRSEDNQDRLFGPQSWCSECYEERQRRDGGTRFEIDDGAQELWRILEASDGRLVADLKPLFVASRPFVRVVDGDIQAIHVTRDVASPSKQSTGSERMVSAPTVHHATVDRGWFDEILDKSILSEQKAVVYLRPVEETPFGDVRDRGGKSQKLSSWGVTPAQ